jgi:hypothetical protein
MSLFQTVNSMKDEALNIVVCPIVIRLGIQTISAASLLIGEVTLSYPPPLWRHPSFTNRYRTDGISRQDDLHSGAQESRNLEAESHLQAAVLHQIVN